ncbi:hypothetical protein [Pandoraea sputorum]|uniref:hypothetical protein n=1 Tax=Pandoraea sputorum TaxID=93222 RepID=UPI001240109E|nr:hypothetical protein [Pandoraea sputorum]
MIAAKYQPAITVLVAPECTLTLQDHAQPKPRVAQMGVAHARQDHPPYVAQMRHRSQQRADQLTESPHCLIARPRLRIKPKIGDRQHVTGSDFVETMTKGQLAVLDALSQGDVHAFADFRARLETVSPEKCRNGALADCHEWVTG